MNTETLYTFQLKEVKFFLLVQKRLLHKYIFSIRCSVRVFAEYYHEARQLWIIRVRCWQSIVLSRFTMVLSHYHYCPVTIVHSEARHYDGVRSMEKLDTTMMTVPWWSSTLQWWQYDREARQYDSLSSLKLHNRSITIVLSRFVFSFSERFRWI